MGGEDSEESWLLGKKPYGVRRAVWKAGHCYGCCEQQTRCWWLLVLVVIGALWLWHASSARTFDPGLSFVTVSDGKFYADCRPLYLAGFNTHDLVQAALMTTYDYNMQDGKSGRSRIREMLGQASAAGLNVIRTWAHTNHKKFPFQTKPGQYNEKTFKALDYILDEARRRGIRVILSVVDNWKYYNGVDQYVDWSETAPRRTQKRPEDKDGDPKPMAFDDENIKNYEVSRHMLFYNDTDCKKMYKSHVHSLVNRKNYLNGMLYKDDPTILAWDLINEPRCESWMVSECPQLLQSWIEEMAAYFKSIDDKHLLTIGSEGFFGTGARFANHNPQDWGQEMGQNFTKNHLPEEIDFATIHVWPNNWDRTDMEFQDAWIRIHIDVVEKELGKPLLLEEFGKKLDGEQQDDPSSIESIRDPVYKRTFAVVEEAMSHNRNVVGSLFWRWNIPLFTNMGRGDYGVRPGDSSFEYAVRHASYINRVTNSHPPHSECKKECWVPKLTTGWYRQCQNSPEVCEAFWMVHTGDKADADNLVATTVRVNDNLVSLEGLQVFPTKTACCRPGQGAFTNGCSWPIW